MREVAYVPRRARHDAINPGYWGRSGVGALGSLHSVRAGVEVSSDVDLRRR